MSDDDSISLNYYEDDASDDSDDYEDDYPIAGDLYVTEI